MENKITTNCTGCFCCTNICPVNCISMIENEYGEITPQIDEDKCIHCDKCRINCPSNKENEFHDIQKCYAGWDIDKNERYQCSSGGVASVLSKKIIRDGGIVIGAIQDKNLVTKHSVASTEEQLNNFRGSKYVHSYINDTYITAKRELDLGKKLLFIGTPCQIAGLYSFLGRKNYENLYTIDLVCHGVPPQRYFLEHMNFIKEKRKIEFDKVSFRGLNDFFLCLTSKNKVISKKHFLKDSYFYGFCNQLMYRENCYQCPYATKKRVADITLGDFWGLGREIPFNYPPEKVNVVLVNTKKGQLLLDECRNYLVLVERSIEEAIKLNNQLRCPPEKNKYTNSFKKLIIPNEFDEAFKQSGVKLQMKWNQTRITDHYRKIIAKLPLPVIKALGKIKRVFLMPIRKKI